LPGSFHLRSATFSAQQWRRDRASGTFLGSYSGRKDHPDHRWRAQMAVLSAWWRIGWWRRVRKPSGLHSERSRYRLVCATLICLVAWGRWTWNGRCGLQCGHFPGL